MPMRHLITPAALLSPALALAHDGHGLAGAHWHATDTLGLIASAAAVALGLWWSGKDR